MYKPGQWRMVCDVCGFEYFNVQIKERWDGAQVCKADFETRHPQEFGRTVFDNQAVYPSRPEPADVFIDVPYIITQSSIAGRAVAGSAIAGVIL